MEETENTTSGPSTGRKRTRQSITLTLGLMILIGLCDDYIKQNQRPTLQQQIDEAMRTIDGLEKESKKLIRQNKQLEKENGELKNKLKETEGELRECIKK